MLIRANPRNRWVDFPEVRSPTREVRGPPALRHQLPAQWDSGQIDPAVLLVFAHEGQFAYLDVAAALEVAPALKSNAISLLRLGFGTHLYDGQVRHVRPLFLGGQGLGVELFVQLTHAVGPIAHADKDRGGARDESLDLAQRHRERRHPAAGFL